MKGEEPSSCWSTPSHKVGRNRSPKLLRRSRKDSATVHRHSSESNHTSMRSGSRTSSFLTDLPALLSRQTACESIFVVLGRIVAFGETSVGIFIHESSRDRLFYLGFQLSNRPDAFLLFSVLCHSDGKRSSQNRERKGSSRPGSRAISRSVLFPSTGLPADGVASSITCRGRPWCG